MAISNEAIELLTVARYGMGYERLEPSGMQDIAGAVNVCLSCTIMRFQGRKRCARDAVTVLSPHHKGQRRIFRQVTERESLMLKS